MKSFLLLLLTISALSLQAAKPNFPAKVPDNMPDRLSGQIASIVKGSDTSRANAVKKLGEMGNQAIPAAPWITPLLTDQTGLMYIYIGSPQGGGSSHTTMAAVAGTAIKSMFKGKPAELIALYNRKDIANRGYLLPLLGSFNTPEANAVFATSFTNSDERVREKTAEAAKNPRWKDELFKLLANDSSQNVRNAAVGALKRFAGDDISNGFAQYLFDKNPVVRRSAVELMANKKDPRGLAAISKMIAGSDSRGARDCTPFAFDYGKDGLKVLNDALKSRRSQALAILGSSSFSFRLVRSKDMDLILTVAGLVGASDIRVSNRAGQIMHDVKRDYSRVNKDDFKKDPAAREKFESAIVNRIIEALLPVLNSDSRNSIDAALNNLVAWKCVDKRLIAPTVKILGNKDYTIRNNASELLKLQGKEAVPVLIKAAEENNPTTKVAAMKALAVAGYNEAVPVLIKGLTDPSREVRHNAANSLGAIGDRKAIEPLKKRLNDPDSQVAGAAVAALKKLGINDAKPGQTVNDEDLELVLDYYVNSRYQAQRYSAQKKLEDYSLRNPEKFSRLVAKADAKQLKALIVVMANAGGDKNNRTLLQMLKDGKSADLQSQILSALKKQKKFDVEIIGIVMSIALNDKSRTLSINANELVRYMLSYHESKKTVYDICLKTLTKGDPASIKQVFTILNSGIDDPRFVKPLIALLDAQDKNVSHRAAYGLSNLKNKLKDDKVNQLIDEEIMKSALPDLTSNDKGKCLAALNRLVLFKIKSPKVAEKVIPLGGSNDYQIKRVATLLIHMQGDAATGDFDALAKKFDGATGATLRSYGMMLIKSGNPEGIKIVGNAAMNAKSPADRKDCIAMLLQTGKNRELVSEYIYKVAIKDSDPNVRIQAAYDLVRFWRGCHSIHRGAGEKEANAALNNLLGNGDRNQKSRILIEMGNFMDSSFKPTLEKISQGNDKGLKYYADRVLQHMAGRRPSTTVRTVPVRQVQAAPGTAVQPKTSLDDLVKQSTSTSVAARVAAVKGLAAYKEESSTDALKARMKDPSRSVSYQAWGILRKRGINLPSPTYLKDAPANDEELAICIAALSDRQSSTLRNAIGALSAKAKKDPSWLKEFCNTEDQNKLDGVIPVLANVADETSIDKLLEYAGKSSISSRRRNLAINSLRDPLNRLRSKDRKLYEKCLAGIIRIVQDDTNSSVRRQALRLLTYQSRFSKTIQHAWPELAKSKDSYVANTAKRYLPRKR